MEHEFDFLAIIDLEATCDEGTRLPLSPSNLLQGLIAKERKIVHSLQQFVQPILTTELTEFCSKLTGISTSTLKEKGVTLQHAIEQLDNFIEENVISKNKTFCFATDGQWDIKFQLVRETILKKIPLKFPQYYKFIDVQHCFQSLFPLAYYHPHPSLKFMMDYLGLSLEGRHHSGIDDCKTIANLITKLIERGYFFQENSCTVLSRDFNPLNDPTHVDFGFWFTEQNLTKQSVLTACHFGDEEVQNVYRMPYLGPESLEFNFVLIVKDYKAQNYFYRSNLLCHVYNSSHFEQLLKNHDILAILTTFLPSSCVWKQELNFREHFYLSLRRLKMSLIGDVGLSFSSARKFWKEGSSARAKLYVGHVFKAIKLAVQLATHGKILEFSDGNDEIRNVKEDQSCDSGSVEDFESKYRKKYEELDKQFKAILHNKKEQYIQLEKQLQLERSNQNSNHDIPIIVDLLKTEGVENIAKFLSVVVTRHPHYHNLIHLKYDNEHAILEMSAVQNCNGLIVDEKHDWNIVCFPMSTILSHNKIFYGKKEKQVQKINWQTARVYEDLDGVVCTLFYYDNQWQLSSACSPVASDRLNNNNQNNNNHNNNNNNNNSSINNPGTLHYLFWECWHSSGYQLPTNTEICYMFILTSPAVVNICRYQETRILCIGARHLKTHLEAFPEELALPAGWNTIKPCGTFSSYNELLGWLNNPTVSHHNNPTQFKGCIVCDDNFNRVYVNTVLYNTFQEFTPRDMDETHNTKRMVSVILNGISLDFLTFYPFLKPLYETVHTKSMSLQQEVADIYAQIKDKDMRSFSQFANEISKKNKAYSAVLFAMKKSPLTQTTNIAEMIMQDNNLKNAFEQLLLSSLLPDKLNSVSGGKNK